MNQSIPPLIQIALEAMPNFLLIDENGIIIYINQVYADLLGKPLKDILYKPVASVIPGTRMLHILKTGKKEIGDIMTLYDHRLNQNVDLVCNRLPLFKNNKIIGAIAMTTFEDIADIHHLYSELEKMKKENEKYKEKIRQLQSEPLNKIIGSSSAITDIKNTISTFAGSNLTILLTGETGTGKEVFARAIHELSNRSLNNYIKINCAAIPKDLLESELFGYEEGAFTGAKRTGKIGKFELANNGTLLLDEIGEMPLPLQAKLLRVLQEKEIERLGSNKPKKIDVRVICSTNVNIKNMIKEGKFREDLYYRINTVELSIPPLRERTSDIPALCNYFIHKINEENHIQTQGISDEVLDLFQKYSWPGNVRELEHTIERLAFQNQNSIITINNCGFLISKMDAQDSALKNTYYLQSSFKAFEAEESENQTLQSRRDFSEIDSIRNALRISGGNKTKAAKLLGISRSMLYIKLEKYHIKIIDLL